MINYVQAVLDSISIHYIPNKADSSSAKLSEQEIPIHDELLKDALLKLFFHSFKEPEYYRFDIDEEKDHLMFNLISTIFDDPTSTHASSLEIANHLFHQSNHPNINSGELMVSYIDDVLIDDEMLSAVAIVKSENKESFLDIESVAREFSLSIKQGIYPSKIDKACVIFNTGSGTGYKICLLDKTKSGDEAVFWTRNFLDCKKSFNDYQKTKVYIQATKSFIEDRLKPLYDLEKQDEVALLDSSKSYFAQNEEFDEPSYLDNLFGSQNDVKDEFKNYQGDYEQEKGHPMFNDFKVSQAAVKNQSKVFKSVIKLDKNFHIYVHGNRNRIEKGSDESGQKFYKLYYDDEV